MSNFAFLQTKTEYELFASAAIEAEKVLATSPAMSAIGCRKALELAVKWVYAADTTIQRPYRDNLQALIHEPSFVMAVVHQTWVKLPYIVKLGNLAVHTEKQVTRNDAVIALGDLFEFIQWVDYCYGLTYAERVFDEQEIPAVKVELDINSIKAQESLLAQKDSELEALRQKITALSTTITENKAENQSKRRFTTQDLSEFTTRKKYIDVDLKLLGWAFKTNVREEIEVEGMDDHEGQPGYVDYVLYGKDGLPLAVIEAKRSSKDPNVGKHQAKLYADCLEKQYGRRPMMFCTNGFETYFWDDQSYPQRQVSSIFSQDDLEKLMNRRTDRKNLLQVPISDAITDRYYQKEAIRAVCDNVSQGHRKNLLVMATGTGKTRVAASLTDVLMRGAYVTNVLFLADRRELVKQAKDAFKTYLGENVSLCNLLSNRDDKTARIIFSTYPTILNAIDLTKNDDDIRLFSPAHFDLIIIDEAHRSIFKKYKAIFRYFDALLVGLTATPKMEVDRNTYDFFEMEANVPTYAYDYDTAVNKDHVLVPYYNIETKTKFLDEGIKYDELDAKDKDRYEEDFAEDDGYLPDFVPSQKINKFVFNQNTVDQVLQSLMESGIKIKGGDQLGKSIIFAQNQKHAEYIVKRFDALYPQYKGKFAKRIICTDAYAQSLIDDFKNPEKEPFIAVSVDMLDTGVDVPEIVNLVYFKKIQSKTKFWQMLGRGTRLCKDLACLDLVDGEYVDKRRYFVFDYLGNFEFFRANVNGFEGKGTVTLTENIFAKRVKLIFALQENAFASEEYLNWRQELVDIVVQQIVSLNTELFAVRLQLKYIEKYNKKEAFVCLTEVDKSDLAEYVAPLVYMDEQDECAKRFDNFIYGMMLAKIANDTYFMSAKNQLIKTMVGLEKLTTIPQVRDKLNIIKTIQSDEFWQNVDLLTLEKVRFELRSLIQFLVPTKQRIVYTNLTDELVPTHINDPIASGYDYENYRLKVNRYIEENKDLPAINKLRHNIRLTTEDYENLKDLFTRKLGSMEDYRKTFQDTAFGLLIRQVAKLDREAAQQVFSEFISEHNLNQQQIVFLNKIVDYVVENGYMEEIEKLTQAPFDRPQKFMTLFNQDEQRKIISLVRSFKENATYIA